MVHTPLLVGNLEQLRERLMDAQARSQKRLGYRAAGLVVLLALAFLLPAPAAHVAVCLAVFAVLSCITDLMHFVARDWFLHLVELQDLLWPKFDREDVALALLVMEARAAQESTGT